MYSDYVGDCGADNYDIDTYAFLSYCNGRCGDVVVGDENDDSRNNIDSNFLFTLFNHVCFFASAQHREFRSRICCGATCIRLCNAQPFVAHILVSAHDTHRRIVFVVWT